MSDETKELAIGEEGVIDGVKVRCVEFLAIGDCRNCHFRHDSIESCNARKCTPFERADSKWVYFEEVK